MRAIAFSVMSMFFVGSSLAFGCSVGAAAPTSSPIIPTATPINSTFLTDYLEVAQEHTTFKILMPKAEAIGVSTADIKANFRGEPKTSQVGGIQRLLISVRISGMARFQMVQTNQQMAPLDTSPDSQDYESKQVGPVTLYILKSIPSGTLQYFRFVCDEVFVSVRVLEGLDFEQSLSIVRSMLPERC